MEFRHHGSLGHTMPSQTKHPIKRTRTRAGLRRALAWVAALGLLGAAAQANAIVRLERDALEARVEAMRAALHDRDDGTERGEVNPISVAPSRITAQWNNWKNWNNWNNWKNWGNWLNR